MTGYRLCDNCALKYADCKGDKGLEKTRCDYYKKPVVMNVKELAEKVAELEIENRRLQAVVDKCKLEYDECKRIVDEPTPDVTRRDKVRAYSVLKTFCDVLEV